MPMPVAAATSFGIATSRKFSFSQIHRSFVDIRNSKSAEWLLDRFGHRARGETRFEEWHAAPREFERSEENLGCGDRVADEMFGRTIRFRSRFA